MPTPDDDIKEDIEIRIESPDDDGIDAGGAAPGEDDDAGYDSVSEQGSGVMTPSNGNMLRMLPPEGVIKRKEAEIRTAKQHRKEQRLQPPPPAKKPAAAEPAAVQPKALKTAMRRKPVRNMAVSTASSSWATDKRALIYDKPWQRNSAKFAPERRRAKTAEEMQRERRTRSRKWRDDLLHQLYEKRKRG